MCFLIQDIFNGYFPFILIMLALLTNILAILVITLKNSVNSVLALIGLFIVIGGYLNSIGMTFVGLVYLLVYVGAVSMLFLFVLMLINIRTSELVSNTKNSIPLVFLIAIIFAAGNDLVLPQASNLLDAHITSLSNWEQITNIEHIASIGSIMYSNFSIYMFIISFILLIAMVGAIVINISPKISNFDLPYNNMILKADILSTLQVYSQICDSYMGIFALSPTVQDFYTSEEPGESVRLINRWIDWRIRHSLSIVICDNGWNWLDNPSCQPNWYTWSINERIATYGLNNCNETLSEIDQIISWYQRMIYSNVNLSPVDCETLSKAARVAVANKEVATYAQQAALAFHNDCLDHRLALFRRSTSTILQLTMDSQHHWIVPSNTNS